ncbi:MAG TPA: fatty acyl-AMP ligase [Pyrinomonadaceae bacterium]|jgi:fatty-acyl-CoA synthase|nr:fatty acyl-AMP ligase [Pyrinomonadaceae bacterium]
MSQYDSQNSPPAQPPPETLAAVLESLSAAEGIGYYFVGFDSQEQFYSYGRVYAEALRRGAHLSALGLKKGDRVALIISKGPEFVLSFLGAIVAGIVPVPIYPPAAAKSIDGYLDNVTRIICESKAMILLTTEATKPLIESVAGRARELAQVLTTETLFSGDAPVFEPPAVRPDDLCFLQFTSGSTSQPKGVMVTHANVMANATAFMGARGLNRVPEDVGVSWLPLFHDMGLVGFIVGPLVWNNSSVIISTSAFARDPRVWLRTIHKYRGTITYAPNFAYALTTKRLRDQDLESLDLSCLRVAGCGAEPVHAPTLRAFAERLAPAGFRAEAFLPSYGMAEATLAVSFHRQGEALRVDKVDPDSIKWGSAAPACEDSEKALEIVSCGFPFPGHQLSVVGEDGASLPERRVGEIIIRGPSVARGYFNSAEATAATWKSGWLHTGDLGYIADGELFVCGRVKDLIIVRGANFYPHDIEGAVRDLAGIRRGNVVAFGVSDEGEEKLVVVAEADFRDAATLRQSIAARIYETAGIDVHRIVLVPAGTLPKTSSGKPQRRKTRQLYETRQLSEAAYDGATRANNSLTQAQDINEMHAGSAPTTPING